MKASEIFQGSYLKSADLGKHRPVVIIESVDWAELGDDKRRVLTFKGKDKGLVLNKTNWNMIAEITGQDDDDNWVGHAIQLYATKVDYQGKRVPAIRIEVPRAPRQAARAETGKYQPTPQEQEAAGKAEEYASAGMVDESDIPF